MHVGIVGTQRRELSSFAVICLCQVAHSRFVVDKLLPALECFANAHQKHLQQLQTSGQFKGDKGNVMALLLEAEKLL